MIRVFDDFEALLLRDVSRLGYLIRLCTEDLYFEEFCLMISCVNGLVVSAWVGDQLSSINLYRSEGERGIW